MLIQLDESRRRVLRMILVHAVINDAQVADLFAGLDLSADELSFTEKQTAILRKAMPWARGEFVRAKENLDDMEAARAEIEGELSEP